MAQLSLRDRVLSPPVARAVVSPTGLLALAGGAAVGVAAGWDLLPTAALAAGAYLLRVALAVPRRRRPERIDPFTVVDPWRRYVQDSLRAHGRFRRAVEQARPGPTRDRLREIGERVDTGVQEVWRVARRGHELVRARRQLDPASIRLELQAAEPDGGPVVEALRAQLATIERMDRVIEEADQRLRVLTARLDEAAARTIELAVHAHDAAELRGLGRDVEGTVDEMEALRLAIEELGGEPAAGAG